MNHCFECQKKGSMKATKEKQPKPLQHHRHVYMFTFGAMNSTVHSCTSCYAMPKIK